MKKQWKWLIIIAAIVLILIVSAVAFIIYESDNMVMKKPAIYLYPLQDSFVSVHLDINGKMVNDIPAYGNGWNVFVTRDGVIDGKYDYLFYEAKLNKLKASDEGWVVSYDELNSWFDTNLYKLGLNKKESEQFKEYWLNELPKSNYYEIKLLSKEYLDKNMNLVILPRPDTVIRLDFYFRPLKEFEQIDEPVIKTPARQGFTVVEWGGILDD